ncbi:hypothetical protein IKF84_01500 [Candidatus Saccharibacteria bacterium]|nr:hypothetical protein [Candidatus Saccharibacteria bacterium]
MITVNFSPRIDENKLKQILGEIEDDKMGGWVNLPVEFDDGELARIRLTAERIKEDSEVLVCIGIGGSYLGHRAIIEALQPKGGVEIVYAGNSLSQRELDAALKKVKDRDFSINVISKSGTTMEPARAFEAFKKKLAERYGVAGAIRRIYVTTDGSKGALHNEAERDNYTRFAIPNDLGGRYSVLSAVGLLPMAAAGVNINDLLDGAAEFVESMEKVERIEIEKPEVEKAKTSETPEATDKAEKSEKLEKSEKPKEAEKSDEPEKSEKSKAPETHTLPLKANGQPDIEGEEIEDEEVKKIMGEKKGEEDEKKPVDEEKKDEKKSEKEAEKEAEKEEKKEYKEVRSLNVANPAFKYAFMRKLLSDKGYDTEVFASFEPSTMYFNEWLKQLFGESEGKNRQGIFPASVIYSTDLHSLGQFMQDGRRNLFETIINYPTDDLNAKVVEAVQTAHGKGGLPVLKIDVTSYDAKGFGELIYFFEMACAIYCKLVGVNPFDQPGVEAYKKELARLMEESDI